MGHICGSSYHWIPAVCSAASIQEKLAEHSGQCTSSITGSRSTVGILYSIETQGRWIQLSVFIAALPLMYFVMYVACKLLSWLGILQKCKQKSKNICQSLGHNFRQQELCDEGHLPDRVVNPFEYQQLPQNQDND